MDCESRLLSLHLRDQQLDCILMSRRQWLDEQHGPGSGAAVLAENAAEEAAAAAALSVKRVGTVDDLQCLDEDLEAGAERPGR